MDTFSLQKSNFYSVLNISFGSIVSQNNPLKPLLMPKRHIWEWPILLTSAAKHFIIHRTTPTTENYQVSNVNIAKAEKPQSRNIEVFLPLIFGRLTQTSFVTFISHFTFSGLNFVCWWGRCTRRSLRSCPYYMILWHSVLCDSMILRFCSFRCYLILLKFWHFQIFLLLEKLNVSKNWFFRGACMWSQSVK